MPLQTFLTQLGIAKETTWGTGVAPSTADQFIPVSNLKILDVIDRIPDEGFRGLASKTFGIQQGFRYARVTFDCQVYPQIVPHFLKALLGGVDTVTGVGPYTHTIPQLNSGLPPSYTLVDFDATLATSRQVTGAYLEQVQLSYASTGAMKMSLSFVGKYSGTVAKPTAVYATDAPFVPANNAALVNASSTTGANLVNLSLTLKRQWEGIWGAGGTQDLTAANLGPIEMTGSVVFIPVDATEINLYRNNTQGQFQCLFTSGTNTLNLNAQTATFVNGTLIERTAIQPTVKANLEAIYNSTDAGTFKAIAANSKSTAY